MGLTRCRSLHQATPLLPGSSHKLIRHGWVAEPANSSQDMARDHATSTLESCSVPEDTKALTPRRQAMGILDDRYTYQRFANVGLKCALHQSKRWHLPDQDEKVQYPRESPGTQRSITLSTTPPVSDLPSGHPTPWYLPPQKSREDSIDRFSLT